MVSISWEKVTLSNGLDVILHEDHSIPLASVNVWYHVGSKNEVPGRTGFAHLFEHVMFEGSGHHNSSHFEPLQKVGANLNGSTNPDRTNYWEDVPSNYLELALWLESDRMGFLLDALDQQRFEVQRDVVKNERRQSYENRPYGMAQWNIQEAVFPLPHPYHWMTIGSQEDLDAASLDDIKDFFRRFYSPSNASLSIAGDIRRDETLEMVDRYFGDLPPGPPVRRIGRFDSSLGGRVELEMRDKVSLPRLYIVWPALPDNDPDEGALEMLRAVLADGQSSRLYRSLVYEKQIAQSVGVRNYSAEIAGQFIVEVTAAAGHSLDEVEAAVDAEIDRIWREPPTEEELQRARNRLESSHFRQLARIGGFGGRADVLNYYNVLYGDPNMINTGLEKYMAVQRKDIMRVGPRVLDRRQVRMKVLPENSLRAASTTGLDRTVMPDAGEEPEFAPPVPVHRALSNGLKVTVVEKRSLPIVSFALMFEAGAVTDPPGKPGLSSFTSQLLPEGTSTRSSQDIANAFEFIGARLSSETRKEISLLSTETLGKHWTTALELMADVARNATFPEHEVERVRREHLTDIRRGKDDPTFLAERIIPRLAFGRDSRYGHPSMGTEESVEAFSAADLRSYFENYYRPSLANLVVVGDVSLEEVMAEAERVFGSWDDAISGPEAVNGNSTGQEPGIESTTIYLVDKPGAAQSVIRAGHLTVPRSDPDFGPLTLLNFCFGGQFSARLNQNLRQDKGYSYGFNSGISWFQEPSLLVAGGSVQTAVTRESVEETLKEFREVHSERPVTEEELESAKAGMMLGYPAGFERPGQVLSQVINLLVHDLPDDYFRTFKDRITSITLDDVRNAGLERIRPSELHVLVVGDRATVEPGLRELDLPLVVLDSEGAELAL
ncbi:MAG: pitrilysin family protein [Chloroflexota bacterium]|nr:pitrilysin family protein [Chloroflexota bacterium]